MDNASGAINQPEWVRIMARIVYPVALAGAAIAAVLNAITWLPLDVAGLTPVWALLFVGVFLVFFAVILVIVVNIGFAGSARDLCPGGDSVANSAGAMCSRDLRAGR